MRRRNCVNIVEPVLGGHGKEQLAAITSLLSEAGVPTAHVSGLWPQAFAPRPLLFLTVDRQMRQFMAVALARAFALQRTVAIWHRPKAFITLGSGLRRFVKICSAKLMRSIPLVSVISVQPPELEPEIEGLTTDWIYQTAQWFQPPEGSKALPASSELAALIDEHAGRRPICMYLGEALLDKGFDFFAELAIESSLRGADVAYLAAGKVNSDSRGVARTFVEAGGLLVDRYLSDAEFWGCVRRADWIWACYPGKNDQNSGIFGMAYQLGRKVMVRKGSFIGRLASHLQFPVIEVEFGNVKDAMKSIEVSQADTIACPARAILDMMKEHTRERLLRYLGVGPA